jgi:tetratricopeptide (TPR) repeat protein
MFKPTVRTFFCLAGILLLITGSPLFGQDAVLNLQQVQSEAMNKLEGGDYRSALSGFRKLMDAEPDNALYPYYAGICLVELNEDLDDAIEYLYGASGGGVPSDAKYYLGKAYHRDYNFSDARKYYSQFEGSASRQE